MCQRLSSSTHSGNQIAGAASENSQTRQDIVVIEVNNQEKDVLDITSECS